jgi:hypothetical protein
MNLFILSLIQREIAQFMMDKHVSKILLEAVQMLCSAKRILDPEDTEVNDRIYKLAHKNHPVTIWCRKSRANYLWALDLVEELHNEWRFRYGHPDTKIHKAYLTAIILRDNIPAEDKFEVRRPDPTLDTSAGSEILSGETSEAKRNEYRKYNGLTPFALAMPDEYKSDDVVDSYRRYYMSPEKQRIASWNKKRERPDWYRV